MNDYEYGRKVVEGLNEVLDSNSEVLDIGAGPGTFVIPLARKVRKVTAVEPSKEMVEYLRRNAEEEGIENFEVINTKWEDVEDVEIAGKFDLVISSIVSWIFKDVWEYFSGMERASKGYCAVVEGVGMYNEGKFNVLSYKLMGEEHKWPWSDYNVIYNILYNRGRFANVKIINYATQRSVDGWIRFMEDFFDDYIEVTPEVKRIIKQHAKENAVGGKILSEVNASVIWWKTQDRSSRGASD